MNVHINIDFALFRRSSIMEKDILDTLFFDE